jgi:lambda repressor-like predicted transcriptional regulator
MMPRRPAKPVRPDEKVGPRARRIMVASACRWHGTSLAEVGRRVGVGRSMVSQVVGGGKRSPKVERALARLVGVPPKDLFPPRASRTRNTSKES